MQYNSKKLNINTNTLNFKVEGDMMVVEIIRQKPLSDLEKFAIYVDEELDSVELKKKSSRGEF